MPRRVKKALEPEDYFLGILRQEKPERLPGELARDYALRCAGWQERRFEAAKAVAPYRHPKLESVAHTGAGGKGPVEVKLTVRFVRPKGAVA